MNWKERLYKGYVSSGQAGIAINRDYAKHYAKFTPYAKLLSQFLGTDKSIKIVDLGCGNGGFLYYFKSQGFKNIQGVDLAKDQVLFAHQAGLTEIVQGDMLTFLKEQANNSIAVILLIDILEHLTRQELVDFLDICLAKTKKSGKLIIHVPNGEGIFGLSVRYGDLTHEQAFTRGSIRQLMRTVGFKKISCYEDKPIIKNFVGLIRRVIWEVGTIQHRLLFMAESGGVRPILSQNLLVIVEK